jgi:hypothetical protein
VADFAQESTVAKADASSLQISGDKTITKIARHLFVLVACVVRIAPIVDEILTFDHSSAYRTTPGNVVFETIIVIVLGSVCRVSAANGIRAMRAGKVLGMIMEAFGLEKRTLDRLSTGIARGFGTRSGHAHEEGADDCKNQNVFQRDPPLQPVVFGISGGR